MTFLSEVYSLLYQFMHIMLFFIQYCEDIILKYFKFFIKTDLITV